MKYLVIGGVAGGATVAARLRRLDEEAQIVLFERGEYVSYANCGLPYYIGGEINDRKKLFVQTVQGLLIVSVLISARNRRWWLFILISRLWM